MAHLKSSFEFISRRITATSLNAQAVGFNPTIQGVQHKLVPCRQQLYHTGVRYHISLFPVGSTLPYRGSDTSFFFFTVGYTLPYRILTASLVYCRLHSTIQNIKCKLSSYRLNSTIQEVLHKLAYCRLNSTIQEVTHQLCPCRLKTLPYRYHIRGQTSALNRRGERGPTRHKLGHCRLNSTIQQIKHQLCHCRLNSTIQYGYTPAVSLQATNSTIQVPYRRLDISFN